MHDFRPIELNDKETFTAFFAQDPPTASELTFTNLFMWRLCYRTMWKVLDDCLLIVYRPEENSPFGLQPVGPGNKEKALEHLCEELGKVAKDVKVCRADKSFVHAHVDPNRFEVVEDRDNSDYVYLTENLIKLPGNKFHRKKNHLNRFLKNYEFDYLEFDRDLAQEVLNLQESWCRLRECVLNPGLFQEDVAIHEAMEHFEDLEFKGAAIAVDSKVQAFSFGELLNPNTAVIHIEKANPEIPGLYAAINQLFCEEAWSFVKYVNREQDLGLEGLRQAKLSYNPDHLVEKFTVIPKT